LERTSPKKGKVPKGQASDQHWASRQKLWKPEVSGAMPPKFGGQMPCDLVTFSNTAYERNKILSDMVVSEREISMSLLWEGCAPAKESSKEKKGRKGGREEGREGRNTKTQDTGNPRDQE
jgi:hypothetical protein